MEAVGLRESFSHMRLKRIRMIAIKSKMKTDTFSAHRTLPSNKGPEGLLLELKDCLNLINLSL